MTNRAPDLFRQSERNLGHARSARADGTHEWACFAAQQAAEQALKAIYVATGSVAWDHSIASLLRDLPGGPAPDTLLELGMILDGYYIPTRYAESFTSGAPGDHFGDRQSKEAIEHASALVEFAREALAEQDRG